MDGVLIDSNPIHGEIWLEYLAQAGLPSDGIDTWMAGKRNDEIMRRLLGADASDDDVFRHGAAKEAAYRERMRPVIEARLMPGIRPLLNRLRHVPLGLGSNAEPANVAFLLEEAGLTGVFQAIVDGHQVARPKPAPDVYLRVAELLRVDPAKCAIFEDSPSGIRAANAAGARVIGVNRSGESLADTELTIRDFLDPALDIWLGAAGLQPPQHQERR